MIRRFFLLWLLCVIMNVSWSDEIRPAYLELTETTANTFAVIWKVPAKGDKKLSLAAELPDNCSNTDETRAQFINNAYIQRWLTHCVGGGAG